LGLAVVGYCWIVPVILIWDEGFWSIYEGGWGFGSGWVTMANWIQWTEEWLAGAVGLMGLSDGDLLSQFGSVKVGEFGLGWCELVVFSGWFSDFVGDCGRQRVYFLFLENWIEIML
jgi:hypothetical protein